MLDDLEKNLDILLRFRLIESNNRLDFFSPEVDSVKPTAFGAFALRQLVMFFTYIELVSADCGIFEEAVANEIGQLSNADLAQFLGSRRLERVGTRIKKAEAFIAYLEREEGAEVERYMLTPEERFMPAIRAAFANESVRVLKSARKNS